MCSLVEPLRRVPLFASLSDNVLKSVATICTERPFEKKSHIFHEGEEKTSVYFIEEGLVKTYKTDNEGNERIISILHPGDMFPHIGLFAGDAYPATAQTLTRSRLIAIPVDAFERLIVSMPHIAISIMRVMSEKMKELQERLQSISGLDVHERGVLFLLRLAEQYGKSKGDGVHLKLPLTNQELASAIGTTRESVNRFLSQLRKEGLIQSNKNEILILNKEALLERLRI